MSYEGPVHTTDLYFETHITIDPVEETQELELKKLVTAFGFRVAELYLKKGGRSRLDSFMTTRGTDYDDVYMRTLRCVNALINVGYNVRRYKIENTLLDVRL